MNDNSFRNKNPTANPIRQFLMGFAVGRNGKENKTP
jgi:hypothetical protein